MQVEQSEIKNILRFQQEYRILISEFVNRHDINALEWNEIAFFMDEVKFFWLARLEPIEVELEILTKENSCFLLSGAIYLNVSDNEHFYFKSLGDYHILDDPLLRMENFFRLAQDSIDTRDIVDYFRRVILDNIEVLDNCQNAFLILPIRLLAIEDQEAHQRLLNDFFLRFLSNIFGKEYTDQDSFCQDFETFEEIEEKLDAHIRELLIFNQHEKKGLTLRKKIELHNKSKSYTQLMADQPEATVFFVTLFSYLSQILDTLLTCVPLRIYPYIRYEVAFQYLLLVMYTFIDDPKLRDMIEKAIIFFIFRKTMENLFDYHESFEKYCEIASEKKALPDIINRMREQKIDIFHDGGQKVSEIINDLFVDEISRLTRLATDAKCG